MCEYKKTQEAMPCSHAIDIKKKKNSDDGTNIDFIWGLNGMFFQFTVIY